MKQFIFIFLIFFTFGLFSQTTNEDLLEDRSYLEDEIYYVRKPDIGFFFGSSNPFPNTKLENILNPTLDFGLFTRFPFYKLYTELNIKSNTYLSDGEAAVMAIPVFASLSYELPLGWPLDLFIKAGGGSAYTVTRPSNLARWNPIGFLGFETSFVTANTTRIGLRIDYNIIYETQLKSQNLVADYLYLQASLVEPRFYRLRQEQKLYNAEFFDFNLVISFFL